MSEINQHTFELNKTFGEIAIDELEKWFENEGFEKIIFTGSKEYISTIWANKEIVFKIQRRENFSTYCKAASYGGLVVFEVSIQDNRMIYECYCPLLLFGLWSKKLAFEENASEISKYLADGYIIHEKLKEFLYEKNQ